MDRYSCYGTVCKNPVDTSTSTDVSIIRNNNRARNISKYRSKNSSVSDKLYKRSYQYNNYENVYDTQFDYGFLNPVDRGFNVNEQFANRYKKKSYMFLVIYIVIFIILSIIIFEKYIFNS